MCSFFGINYFPRHPQTPRANGLKAKRHFLGESLVHNKITFIGVMKLKFSVLLLTHKIFQNLHSFHMKWFPKENPVSLKVFIRKSHLISTKHVPVNFVKLYQLIPLKLYRSKIHLFNLS